jgi:3-hydroxyisobutyrate dehydrogenase-like beta-hydroxyacid dehydrogenase
MTAVAVIGAGIMRTAIAICLLDCGHKLSSFDLYPDKVAQRLEASTGMA